MKRLEQFNHAEMAQEANRFFGLLHQEEFTDSLIHFSATTPIDTLRALGRLLLNT